MATAKKKAEPPPPTPPSSPEELRSRFKRFIDTEVSTARTHLDKWAEEFKTHPMHALEWGAQIYEDAAKLEVMGQVQALLACEPPLTLPELVEMITKDALAKGRYIVRSTSVSTNLIAQHLSAVWADMAHQARKWLV